MAEGLQLPVGQVPSDWKVLSLKDVSSKIGSGSTPRGGASVYVQAGTAFIRSQNVLDHGFSSDGLVRINDEAAYSLRGVEVLNGDVLINITGDSILRTCIVPNEVLPARVSQHVAILRSNGLIEPQVLQKWLSLEVMKDFMLGHSSGGTRKAVTKGDLERFPVPVPPLREQKAIADVLSALDDKIESTRRLMKTVDELLRVELTSAIVSDSEPREVKFGEIAVRIGDATDPRKLDSHVPYIGLEHMPRGVMFLDEWGTSEGLGSGKSLFEKGDVLFGRLRPYFKKVGIAPVSGVCSTDVLVLRPSVGESSAMLLALAASEEFIAYASAAATGTKMPRVSWDYLAAWQTLVPSPEVTARYEESMSPLVTKAVASIHERVLLAQLRDSLLPELLSGRLRVKDAESIVENV